MNVLERSARQLDGLQQRHVALALPIAVMKKFGDDNAGVLVSNLVVSALAALFPLLLLLVTVLGIVLGHDQGLRERVLHSTLADFPVVGNQLGGNIHALQRGSTLALAVALAALAWSSTGLAQAGLFAMSEIWNLPGPQRPNYLQRLTRSFLFLGVLVVGLVVTTWLVGLGAFVHRGLPLTTAAECAAVTVNVGQYLLVFRVLTSTAVRTRCLWPGALLGGVGWTALQAVGGYLIAHDLRNTSEVYGTFAVVLGLLAWIYLGVRLSVYAGELNVVLARHLWPRGIVQPPLTEADQRSLSAEVKQNQRRPEQTVEVFYGDPPQSQDEFLKRSRRSPDRGVDAASRSEPTTS
jgi:YihY family inner membrane protein